MGAILAKLCQTKKCKARATTPPCIVGLVSLQGQFYGDTGMGTGSEVVQYSGSGPVLLRKMITEAAKVLRLMEYSVPRYVLIRTRYSWGPLSCPTGLQVCDLGIRKVR